MKKHSLALALALAAGMTTAQAQDDDWSGFYVGGTLTGAQHSAHWTDVDYYYFGSTQTLPYTGFMLGASGGYGWQSGATVFGVELALDVSGMENSTIYGSGDIERTDTLKNVLTLRGRYGVAVDESLFYFTGGLAKVSAEHDWVDIGGDGTEDFHFDNGRLGYTFGFGFEHPLFDSLTIKAEYLQTRVPEESDVNIDGDEMRVGESIDALRVGVNYKF